MDAPPARSTAAPLTVALAGGGSGGHIYPGLAIAERLGEVRAGSRAIFICSDRAIDRRILEAAGAAWEPIEARPFSPRPLAALRFARSFRAARRHVRSLLRRRSVDHLLALGGFVAAPAVVAAGDLGLPVTLVNLDAPPGKANRWMARRCTRVLSAIALPGRPGFAERVTGMPVRTEAIAAAGPEACRERLGLDPRRSTLLVAGGSQGAASVNEFVTAVAAHAPDAFDGWQVHHLCGAGAEEAVTAAYRGSGVRATVAPFCDRMGLAWGAADLAVSRSGASSVAEAAVNAVPALFLPYPFHRDEHQRLNAEPLASIGAAVVARDRVDALVNVREIGPLLLELMADPARRAAMAAAARAHRPPDAALEIARIVLGEAMSDERSVISDW